MNTSKRMLKRILIMAVVIIFLMTTTVARVFYLTIVRGEELSEKAETQQLKDTEITAMRGTIYDSNGNVLASRLRFGMYLSTRSILKTSKEI